MLNTNLIDMSEKESLLDAISGIKVNVMAHRLKELIIEQARIKAIDPYKDPF